MQPIAYFAVLALTPHGETGMKAVHYRKALPALLGLLLATAAPAANTGFYLGGDLGRANVAYDPYTFNLSGPAVGYDLAAGYRPIDALAGELSYTGFGRATSGPYYVDTSAVGVFALGYLPVPWWTCMAGSEWRTGAAAPIPPAIPSPAPARTWPMARAAVCISATSACAFNTRASRFRMLATLIWLRLA